MVDIVVVFSYAPKYFHHVDTEAHNSNSSEAAYKAHELASSVLDAQKTLNNCTHNIHKNTVIAKPINSRKMSGNEIYSAISTHNITTTAVLVGIISLKSRILINC